MDKTKRAKKGDSNRREERMKTLRRLRLCGKNPLSIIDVY